MSWYPGAIRKWYSIEGYKRQNKGTRESYFKRKKKRTVCPFLSCDKDLALGSLQSHFREQQWMDACSSIITELIALAPCLYKLSFKHQSRYLHQVPFLVEDCHYTATTAANLQQHFFNRHYTHRLHLKEDNSVPSCCRACGILVSLHSLYCGHCGSKQCKANIKRNQQSKRNEAAAKAQARTFTIDDIKLKKVENFKYLGIRYP